MPELPEVEITARRLGASLAGVQVESALAPGMVAMKSVDPPLGVLASRRIAAVRRIGKMPVVGFDSLVEGMTQSLPEYRRQHVAANADMLRVGYEVGGLRRVPFWDASVIEPMIERAR